MSFGNGTLLGFLSGRPAAPLIQIVTAPGVALPMDPEFSATCTGPSSPSLCPQAPTVTADGPLSVLAWNWSAEPSANSLVSGDSWTIGFTLVAAPGASGAVPVYLCSSPACTSIGAGPGGDPTSELAGLLEQGSQSTAWNASLPALSLQIQSPSEPQVALSASGRFGEAPYTVTFATTVLGGVVPTTETIDFGDGQSASGATPVTHTYAAGDFTVTAYLIDALGRVAQSSVSVDVVSALQSWFSQNVTAGYAPLSVSFTGSAQWGQGPYTYAWSFGDGATSTLPSPAHVFTSAGHVERDGAGRRFARIRRELLGGRGRGARGVRRSAPLHPAPERLRSLVGLQLPLGRVVRCRLRWRPLLGSRRRGSGGAPPLAKGRSASAHEREGASVGRGNGPPLDTKAARTGMAGVRRFHGRRAS